MKSTGRLDGPYRPRRRAHLLATGINPLSERIQTDPLINDNEQTASRPYSGPSLRGNTLRNDPGPSPKRQSATTRRGAPANVHIEVDRSKRPQFKYTLNDGKLKGRIKVPDGAFGSLNKGYPKIFIKHKDGAVTHNAIMELQDLSQIKHQVGHSVFARGAFNLPFDLEVDPNALPLEIELAFTDIKLHGPYPKRLLQNSIYRFKIEPQSAGCRVPTEASITLTPKLNPQTMRPIGGPKLRKQEVITGDLWEAGGYTEKYTGNPEEEEDDWFAFGTRWIFRVVVLAVLIWLIKRQGWL